MKSIILALFLLASIVKNSSSLNQYELGIVNSSTNGRGIGVYMYPVSMIFNGGSNYSLQANYPLIPSLNKWYYKYLNLVGFFRDINGNYIGPYQYHGLAAGGDVQFNMDHAAAYLPGCYCYGIYKVVITYSFNGVDKEDSVLIDYDYTSLGSPGDDFIYFKDDNNNPRLVFHLENYGDITINSSNYFIKPWQLYGRSRDFGDFRYNSNDGNSNHTLPLDSRRDCETSPLNHNALFPWNWYDYADEREGILNFNLTLEKNSGNNPVEITSPLTFWNDNLNQVPAPIIINEGAHLTLAPGLNNQTRKLTLNKFTCCNKGTDIIVRYGGYLVLANAASLAQNAKVTVNDYCNITNQSYGAVVVGNYDEISIQNHGKMTLNQNSHLHLFPDSYLRVYQGGLFCNYGGIISGGGNIVFTRNNIQCPGWQDVLIKDSTQIIVEDTATWALEDSSKITLDGKITYLILKPYSTVKFGPHAKLILKNGARIKADHCTFTALNVGDTWDGIYLNDLAQDTLTNCTIENAVNGINIINRNGSASLSPPPYSTIITNCTFTNTTSSTQLTNAIYATNSDNILIQNDSIISNTAQGFVSGITLDYCGAGVIDITDNIIKNVSSGINVIHTSPYLARNSITGSASLGSGNISG